MLLLLVTKIDRTTLRMKDEDDGNHRDVEYVDDVGKVKRRKYVILS